MSVVVAILLFLILLSILFPGFVRALFFLLFVAILFAAMHASENAPAPAPQETVR